MLLLSSTGTIKSPVGACATAIESLDIGCEAIKSGNSKIAFVGGCDDFQEEMSYEFAKMKATASSADEFAKGRLPSEMSRPSVTSRSGFVESAGCGAQIIMSAEVALEMGLPIYGIVAYTQMASDKIGRSVPAPGQGILTAAKEAESAFDSDLLDLEFRRRHLKESVAQIKKSHQARLARLQAKTGWSDKMLQEIESATACKLKLAQQMWGNDIRLQDRKLFPLLLPFFKILISHSNDRSVESFSRHMGSHNKRHPSMFHARNINQGKRHQRSRCDKQTNDPSRKVKRQPSSSRLSKIFDRSS